MTQIESSSTEFWVQGTKGPQRSPESELQCVVLGAKCQKLIPWLQIVVLLCSLTASKLSLWMFMSVNLTTCYSSYPPIIRYIAHIYASTRPERPAEPLCSWVVASLFCPSVRPSVCSARYVNKLMNTIFWKRINWFRCVLAQVVYGAWTSND